MTRSVISHVARWTIWITIVFALSTLAFVQTASAQMEQSSRSADVVCASKLNERQTCVAHTQKGVTLTQNIGDVPCELGKTWGYDEKTVWVSDGCSGAFRLGPGDKTPLGSYTPLTGFKIADTDRGDINFKIFTYVRYLNQLNLDTSYIDGFGREHGVRRRQDILLQKVMFDFLGWVLDPKFHYYMYAWSANSGQGLGAQVVLGGNLTYIFNKYLAVAGGIGALPGVRATEGNFPLWLTVDNRLLADEFFRPSYTMGVWIKGEFLPRTKYMLMVGNNLSQLGIDAGQLDHDPNTATLMVAWLPSTGEFGTSGEFGDYDFHEKLATRVGGHYTYSVENFQGQVANNDAFENVQIRLSDGNPIFQPDVFGPGIRVINARYQMSSVDAGVKYRGLSLEGEYYWRAVDNFEGPGTSAIRNMWDHGFQLQASGIVIPKLLQAYVSGSNVNGQFGDPNDFRVGVNWFPWRLPVARLNVEYLHLHHSPVGALSLPYVVGGNGSVFYTNFEINF